MAVSRKPKRPELIANAVRDAILDSDPTGQNIAVAYSGGRDSSVLLHAAQAARQYQTCHLSAIHVHHGLHPAADAWAEHCATVCASYDIPLEVMRVRVRQRSGKGLEGAARDARYRALATSPAQRVLLAHHADDQAETVLLNLFRGSGVLGLAAMPVINGRFERPLLSFRRSDIEAYADAYRLRWCDDPSNAETAQTRNWLRNELLPGCTTHFPALAETLTALAGRMAETDHLLQCLADVDAGGLAITFPFPTAPLKRLDNARATNLLHSLLRRNGLQTPAASRLQEFARQLKTSRPDRHPELRIGQWVLRYRQRHLHLELFAKGRQGLR